MLTCKIVLIKLTTPIFLSGYINIMSNISGKKVICLRHIEEPKNKKISKIQTHIGMNNQGVVRTSLMPELIKSLTGGEIYELHTYTHPFNKIPTSRSYYTAQLLLHDQEVAKKAILYLKSDEIDKLVNNVLNSTSRVIVIIWEHVQMTNIIKGLIGADINYNKTAKEVYQHLELKSQFDVRLRDLPLIKRCSDDFLARNLSVCGYYIEPEEDISYALTWTVYPDEKRYEVAPNYIIQRNKNHKKRFKVFKYY